MTALGRLAYGAWIVCLVATHGTAWAQRVAPADQAQTTAVVPAVIPIFPLEDATLFPGASHPFHIFEPRYRAMVADALKGDRIIGMVTLRPGYEADYGGRPQIFPIGCAGLITDVEELPDGRFNIVLQGVVKIRVTSEDQGRPYRLAHVDVLPETLGTDEAAALRVERRRLEALVTRPGSTIPPGIPDEEVVNTLAQYLPLDPPERQTLLELKDALARSQTLIKLIEAAGAPPQREH
jgi:Lon protease-like protein